MKKALSVLLVLAMALSLCACSLFSDESVVQFEEIYTHNDPEGIKYDTRKVMINDDFGGVLEEMVNAMAYPNTIKMDEAGNVVGFYDYDATTGMASGYTDITTGEFVEEEVELGMPDESLMIALKGTVTLGNVIYGQEGRAVYNCLYAFLSDAADKDVVMTNMELYYGWTMEAESDTVLVCKEDEAAIDARFQMWQEMYGQIQSDRSADGYGENLKMDLGLRNYGVNPYAPTSLMQDPEGLEYDTKQILTSGGGYSFVDSSLENDMKVRTDVIYGLNGKVVAHYIYYEYNTKEAADKLANSSGNFYSEPPVRLSDTVVLDMQDTQTVNDTIQAYIGYGVLDDDSFDSYVANVEESYFLMRYEG